MANVLIGNTYIVWDSAGTALTWPAGATINQVRFLAVNTNASAVFQAVAGTPILEWRYVLHELGAGTSSRDIVPALFVVPMAGTRFQAAWIPTTMTACTAWIDFA